MIEKRGRDGSLATVTGGAALLWAARTMRKNAGRATLLALAGVALLGVGRRQRGAGRSDADTGVPVSLDDDDSVDDRDDTDVGDRKRVSDDAHVEATQDLGAGRVADESRTDDQSGAESNPRGTADDAGVQQDDGDDVEFVEGRKPGTHEEPHLEDEHDTRLDTEIGDEPTQVDVSDSATADEASEAAGPQPEQAYPAREGTDPEPTAKKAPQSDEETDSSAEKSDDRSQEASDESEETS